MDNQQSPFFIGKFSNQKAGSGPRVRRQFQATNCITLLAMRFGYETLATSFANCIKQAEADEDPDLGNYQQQLLRYLWLRDEVLYELDARNLLHIQNPDLLFKSAYRYDEKHFPNDNLGVDESGRSLLESPQGSRSGSGDDGDSALPA